MGKWLDCPLPLVDAATVSYLFFPVELVEWYNRIVIGEVICGRQPLLSINDSVEIEMVGFE